MKFDKLKNIINYLIHNQLFKIFSLIIPFIIFKNNTKIAFLFSSLFVLVYICNFESFDDIKSIPVDKVINSLDIKKLNYNIIHSPIIIDELTFKLTKKAIREKDFRKIIENKIIQIFREIKNNNNLKIYLKFMNLINQYGLPSFINECDEVLLSNQIKIILVTMSKLDLDLLKN
jgi:hypothetical protein